MQETIVTEREGRYVIPVKIESRHEIKGIVHDISNTGATVFIEPAVAVGMGNAYRELSIEERREIERILGELSAAVGVHQAEIARNIELAAELDLALAKARFARRFGATEPIIYESHSDDGSGMGGDGATALKLVEARHPLLGEKAVPLSIELGKDFPILVITGPNTGGKTVALKTVGLLSLMAQAGLPIPAAEGSYIPIFDGIFADIGDEQSIQQTISSFSWHIGTIVRIINNATRRSLVLIDELGTSTDPAEGSALARAILGYFLTQGTTAVVTTHYQELKAFAHVTAGMENASLDFDPVTLLPTYHLMVGIPGGSNALETATRLGLAPEIVASAKGMLSKGTEELESLLANLMQETRNGETLRNALEKEKNEVSKLKTELAHEYQRIKVEEARNIRESRDEIVREAAELHREIRQTLSDLKKERSKERIEQAQKTLSSIQAQLQSNAWKPAMSSAGIEKADEDTIAVGDTVWLIEADVSAKVLSVSNETGQIEVQVGRARFTLGLGGVRKIQSGEGLEPETMVKIQQTGGRTISSELDLRGKRADEIELVLDSYLNSASLADLSEVRVVHGVGTGTVRSIVREFIATHPLVKSFRAGGRGEGGDGATVICL